MSKFSTLATTLHELPYNMNGIIEVQTEPTRWFKTIVFDWLVLDFLLLFYTLVAYLFMIQDQSSLM